VKVINGADEEFETVSAEFDSWQMWGGAEAALNKLFSLDPIKKIQTEFHSQDKGTKADIEVAYFLFRMPFSYIYSDESMTAS
jgi:hypothetical protein